MGLRVYSWFCFVSLHRFALIMGTVYILSSLLFISGPFVSYFSRLLNIREDRKDGREVNLTILAIGYGISLGILGILLIIGAIKVSKIVTTKTEKRHKKKSPFLFDYFVLFFL